MLCFPDDRTSFCIQAKKTKIAVENLKYLCSKKTKKTWKNPEKQQTGFFAAYFFGRKIKDDRFSRDWIFLAPSLVDGVINENRFPVDSVQRPGEYFEEL